MSKNEIPRDISEMINDLERLNLSLKEHNDQFSMGASLAGIIGRAMKGQILESSGDNIEINIKNENVLKEQEVDEMKKINMLQLKNSPILNEIGLSLTPAETGSSILGQGDEIKLKKLRFNVANGTNFMTFLENVEQSNVDIEKTVLNNLLPIIIETLSKQVISEYVIEKNEVQDEFLSLIGSAEKIISLYKKIGLEDKTESLKEILKHSREQNLSEYIKLLNAGISSEEKFLGSLYPPQIKWDINPDYFEKQWKRTINVIKKCKENENAKNITEKSISLCMKKLMDVQKKIQEKSDLPEYLSAGVYKKIKNTVEETLKELLDL